jgi:ABC-2 type transport system ATP-binding protein
VRISIHLAMLNFEGVHKQFGKLVAVDALTLHVRPGEVLGFLGPNGAGKTTSLSMAVGLLRPDSGRVSIVDAQGTAHDPSHAHVRRLVGLAPQTLAIYDELSGRENVRFFAKLYGLRGRELEARVDEVIELVGLTDRARDRAGVYSGGMKRRLNLAVAIAHDPALVLLDEPTAGVDPQSRNAIFDIVRELRQRGRTIVYSTHYMEEAERLCDRVAIVDRGRLLAVDTVPALVAAHGGRSVLRWSLRGESHELRTDDPVGELTRVVRERDVDSAAIERPTLEAVFLALTGRTLRD